MIEVLITTNHKNAQKRVHLRAESEGGESNEKTMEETSGCSFSDRNLGNWSGDYAAGSRRGNNWRIRGGVFTGLKNRLPGK